MARNEEKQQGRLNRLWLQKEREEGRIKVHERRPKLSTLNSASSVKKWIPSIKSEIEYYLQQSQLSHYPERKIAEFQLSIDGLEKEYKRFITKLRVLDPSCKHKPWTPRAYAKRREDTQDSPSTVKKPRYCEPHDGGGPLRGAESDLAGERTESHAASEEAEPRAPVTTKPTPEPPRLVACADQDQPLSFDRTRLAVAVAGFRGAVAQPGLSHTHSLVRALQSGLPNLYNPTLGQAICNQSRDVVEEAGERRTAIEDIGGQEGEVKEQNPGSDSTTGRTTKSCITGMMEAGNVLGLGCYSSSDEDSDT